MGETATTLSAPVTGPMWWVAGRATTSSTGRTIPTSWMVAPEMMSFSEATATIASRGGIGNDQLNGGNGNDLMLGQGNDDVIVGANGNDALDGGDGNNNADGGNGSDTCTNATPINCETIPPNGVQPSIAVSEGISPEMITAIRAVVGVDRFVAVSDTQTGVVVLTVGQPDAALEARIRATAAANGLDATQLTIETGPFNQTQLQETRTQIESLLNASTTIQGREISTVGPTLDERYIGVGLVDATPSELTTAETLYPRTRFVNQPFFKQTGRFDQNPPPYRGGTNINNYGKG